MLSILCRPKLFNVGKQLLEPARLMARNNGINKTQMQYFKTSRDLGRNRLGQLNERSSFLDLFESRILRATFCAVGGGFLFFGCSTVWTYENLIKIRKLQKSFLQLPVYKRNQSGSGNPLSRWWNGLKEHEKFFAIICSLNILVFAAWTVPALEPIMMKYFTLNLASNHTFLPMLLSTFSHQSVTHLFCNMYCLYSFSGFATRQWGKETTLAFYMTSGMFGSLGSVLMKLYTGSKAVSLGASAAVLGIISSSCILHPDTQISILFLPFISFTAQSALLGLIAVDLTGLALGWRFFDHAGHLGGALYGIFFVSGGHKLYKEYCKRVVRAYSKIRTS